MLQVTVLIGYLVAAFLLVSSRAITTETRFPRSLIGAWAAGLVGLFAHSMLLVDALFINGGLGFSPANSASLIAWLLAVLALTASAHPGMRGLSAIMLPLSAAGGVLTGLGQPAQLTQILSWELRAHILLAASAYSLFTIAAAMAILLFFQDRRLRTHRRLGWLQILPPVETMEMAMFGTIASGFVLLTLALFAGFTFVEDLFAQHLAHKVVLSLTAWVIFAVLLTGRWRLGWRGRKATYWTLGGFAVLGLAYFGSKLILEIFLGRHWG